MNKRQAKKKNKPCLCFAKIVANRIGKKDMFISEFAYWDIVLSSVYALQFDEKGWKWLCKNEPALVNYIGAEWEIILNKLVDEKVHAEFMAFLKENGVISEEVDRNEDCID